MLKYKKLLLERFDQLILEMIVVDFDLDRTLYYYALSTLNINRMLKIKIKYNVSSPICFRINIIVMSQTIFDAVEWLHMRKRKQMIAGKRKQKPFVFRVLDIYIV